MIIARVTGHLNTTDTITVTFNATTVARSFTLHQVHSTLGRFVKFEQVVTATGSSTTPSVASASVPSGQIVIGGVGAEGNAAITADSDVTNGSWSTAQTSGVGTTTSGVEIISQRKVTTGAGVQTYNVTITTADWAAIIVAFSEFNLVDMSSVLDANSNPPSIWYAPDSRAGGIPGYDIASGRVSSWWDLMGGGFHVTNADSVSGTRPILRTTENGRTCIDFDGDARLGLAASQAEPLTCVVAFKLDANPATDRDILTGDNSQVGNPHVYISSAGEIGSYVHGVGFLMSGVTCDLNFHTVVVVFASAFSQIWVDGVLRNSGTPGGAATLLEIAVGGSQTGGNNDPQPSIDGIIYEFAWWSAAVNRGYIECIHDLLEYQWSAERPKPRSLVSPAAMVRASRI
jgi:hypothetical protein